MLFAIKLLGLVSLAATLTGLIDAASDPLLSSWQQTQASSKGYNSITGGIQKIQYSNDYVYVYTTGIPQYTIGPTWNNPNKPSDQKFWFKFTRSPSVPATKTKVSLDQFGAFLSGVPMFNALDGQTYNNQGYWTRNAYYFEGSSFDSCAGHAESTGVYHQHANPSCQYTASSSSHSPLLGYVFDGYPMYGPYSYTVATDMTSAIKRMVSSYVLRSISVRHDYANGTTLSSTYYGPDVSSTYALGAFWEDYYYSAGSGDLDEYNGRFTKTIDYTSGKYCYFVTIDSSGTPAYPFLIGPYYYGTVVSSNIGSTGARSSPTETVTTYFAFSSAYSMQSSGLKMMCLIVFSFILYSKSL